MDNIITGIAIIMTLYLLNRLVNGHIDHDKRIEELESKKETKRDE